MATPKTIEEALADRTSAAKAWELIHDQHVEAVAEKEAARGVYSVLCDKAHELWLRQEEAKNAYAAAIAAYDDLRTAALNERSSVGPACDKVVSAVKAIDRSVAEMERSRGGSKPKPKKGA